MNPGIPVAIGAPSRPMEPHVRPVTRARREPTPPAVKYMYVVWAIVLFDPHRLLASVGPGIFARTMTFTFMALLVMIALEAPAALSSRRGVWIVFPLMGAFIANALVSSFFALNRGTAWENTQPFIIYYVLGVATFFFIKNARQLLPIIYMLCFYQFLWWEMNARASGVVWWHPTLVNPDGYGPLMVMGMALTYFFALSTSSKTMRWIAFLLSAGAVMGVVASFARGAFVGLVTVAGIIVLRSPKKGRTIVGFAIGGVIMLITASVLYPSGDFWAEMQTIITVGNTGGTGADRWALWSMAWQEYLERPILGVGPGNFGAFAVEFFSAGDPITGQYVNNPGRQYDRQLHSLYFQILCEFGTVGIAIFAGLLFDFFRRNRRLRSPEALERWRQTGIRLDLRALSIAIETAMIATLVTGVFYAAYTYMNWWYSLLIINMTLYGLVVGKGRSTARVRQRRMPPHPSRSDGLLAARR